MKRDKVEHLFDYLPKSKIKAGDGAGQGPYPFYTSSEIQSKYLDKYLYEPGCLVFGTGGNASVHLTTRRFATSTDCITIRPKPDAKIDVGYVFQYLKGNMQILERGFKGAGLKHISKAYISKIQIPHPEDVNDQIRIAYLLGKVEGLITQRKRQLQQLDDLLKSVFLEMFGDPVGNEKGWDSSPIEGLCADIIDCPHSTPIYSDVKTGYFCIRSSDIVDGYLDLDKTYQVDESVFNERIKRYTPQVGDIVYSREGGRLGNAARILVQEKICLGQRMMILKVNSKNRYDFLWALLESASFKFKLQGLVGGGAAPRVNIKDIKKIVVAKPPVEKQDEFSNIVVKIDSIKSRYQQSLAQLENLYGALSQKAFKGALDLSRVPLKPITANLDVQQEGDTLVASATVTDQPQVIDLPDVEDMLEALATTEGRHRILQHWFDTYVVQLKRSAFSVNDFLGAAQVRMAELHPENDFEFGVSEYEQLKDWVFVALGSGRVAQMYDDPRNRVQIVATKS